MADGKNLKLTVLIVTVFLLASSVVFSGCKKEEPVKVEQTVAAAVSDPNAVIEQKICPVMGGEINKNIYAMYKGKKVYFCCPACKPKFEKDPEKYIGKLPQFAK